MRIAIIRVRVDSIEPGRLKSPLKWIPVYWGNIIAHNKIKVASTQESTFLFIKSIISSTKYNSLSLY